MDKPLITFPTLNNTYYSDYLQLIVCIVSFSPTASQPFVHSDDNQLFRTKGLASCLRLCPSSEAVCMQSLSGR